MDNPQTSCRRSIKQIRLETPTHPPTWDISCSPPSRSEGSPTQNESAGRRRLDGGNCVARLLSSRPALEQGGRQRHSAGHPLPQCSPHTTMAALYRRTSMRRRMSDRARGSPRTCSTTRLRMLYCLSSLSEVGRVGLACACVMAFAAMAQGADELRSMLQPGMAPIHKLPPNGSTEQLQVHQSPTREKQLPHPASHLSICVR